ncbi:MAG: hypothetical protein VB142_09430, partial [Burkholderia sp.]
IGDARRKPDTCTGRQKDHDRRLCNTALQYGSQHIGVDNAIDLDHCSSEPDFNRATGFAIYGLIGGAAMISGPHIAHDPSLAAALLLTPFARHNTGAAR